MTVVRINLGCGKDIRKGWINVDNIPLSGVDVIHDLNKFPYPFPSNYADFILMRSILEHLDDTVRVMSEVYRILKPKGKVKIIVPYYRHETAFADPTHKHFFTPSSMDFFIEGGKHADWYTPFKFKLVKMQIYRGGFPFYHLRKYFGIDLKLPLFPDTIEWVLEK